MSVHVAAHPGAETQDRRQLDGLRGHAEEFLERLDDLVVEVRNDSIQDVRQVKEDLLALVSDRQPLPRMLFGLPAGRHLEPDARQGAAGVVGSQGGVEPIEEVLRNPLLLAQQCAPGGFRGVRGEDRLDAQLANQANHFL